jgi:phasin family protein
MDVAAWLRPASFEQLAFQTRLLPCTGVIMFSTPEQLVALHKSNLESFQAMTASSLSALEKLTQLNVAATRSTLAETSDRLSALFEAKDVKQLAELAAAHAQPTGDKVTAYAKHVFDIAQQTGTEIVKAVEQQVAESNRQMHAMVDAVAKTAPAGSEGLVTFVKSAMAAAGTAYDQVNKASKQVVEMAEANVAAATKTTGSSRRAAAH